MDKRIQRMGIFLVVCFLVLFLQLNNIQILKANSLADSPANPRTIAELGDQPRGSILSSDGVTLAQSVPVIGNFYKYRRQYNPYTAELFSQIVGYDTVFGPRTGVEAEYNAYLQAHTRPATTLRDLLVNRTTTEDVTLTISSRLQSEVAEVMDEVNIADDAPVEGAVVIDPKTGAIEGMYSNSTYNPIPLSSLNGSTVTCGCREPVHPCQAAIRYSWMRPPRRSVLRILTRSTSPIGAGVAWSADGARWSKERWGRWAL